MSNVLYIKNHVTENGGKDSNATIVDRPVIDTGYGETKGTEDG